MINKYVAVIVNDYDDGLYCMTITEYIPFQSRYTKDEIDIEYFKNICKQPFKSFKLLDTEIHITNNNRLEEVCTIQAWFTGYAVGVKDETKEEMRQRINSQYK